MEVLDGLLDRNLIQQISSSQGKNLLHSLRATNMMTTLPNSLTMLPNSLVHHLSGGEVVKVPLEASSSLTDPSDLIHELP